MELEEAIEYLKCYKYDNEVKQAIDIVLKELEQAKKQLDLDYVDNNFVSKDKIKDKIKFLDKNIELQWASTSYNEIDVEKYQYAQEILKELLEGE